MNTPSVHEIREELERYQGVLELRDEDVARIEARVTSQTKPYHLRMKI